MSSADRCNRIRFAYHSSDVFPSMSESEIKEDLYVLSSPLCRGCARIEIDGCVIHDGEVRPGMLRLASPGERVRTLVRSPSRAAVLFIPGAELRKVFDSQEYRHRPGNFTYVDPLLQPIFEVERLCASLLSLPDLDREHRQLFIDGLARALLATLLGAHSRRQNSRNLRQGRELSDAEFQRCVDYADSMIEKRLNLDSWANVLGMTATDFARRFHLRTRQAPYAWFINRRIDRAKHLLRDPSLSIANIALDLGFHSQSHFTSSFHRRAGLSPGRWRAETFLRS